MVKRFGLGLLATFFGFAVFVVAVSASMNTVFGLPDTLKDSLAESTVYADVGDAIIDQVVESMQQSPESSRQKGDDLNLDPKTTEKIARRVITPARLQVYAEEIVDGTYNWLEGEVERPDYNIDIGALKKDLGNAVGDTAVERVEDLPVCTLAQLQKLDTSEIDPFTLPCRPLGLNLKAERAKLVREVTASDEFLKDSTVNADNTKDESGQNVFDNIAGIPGAFQLGQKLPWILGVLGTAAAAGIVFWSENRRKGLKKIALILLTNGVLLLIGIWLASSVLGGIRFDGGADDQMREALVGVVRTLNAEFNRTLRVFAIAYAIIGAGGLIGLRLTKPKSVSADKPAEHKKEETPEPKTDSDKS